MASLFVRHLKLGAKQEKKSSARQSQKTFKRYKSSPRRRKTRTVSCSNTYRLPPPKRRSTVHQNKMGTWSSTHLPWYVTPPATPRPPSVAGRAAEIPDSQDGSEVLGNPGAEGMQFLPQELLVAPRQPQHHHPHRVSSSVIAIYQLQLQCKVFIGDEWSVCPGDSRCAARPESSILQTG